MYYNTPTDNYLRQWWKNFLRFFISKNVLSILILINVAVWLILSLTDFTVFISTWFFNGGIHLRPLFHQYLAYPASYSMLLYRPWTMVTSLFVHQNFSHLLFNMLALFVAGHIYLQYKSGKSLLATYFIGGVSGNLLYQAVYNLLPTIQPLVPVSSIVGASGAVVAVLVAITVYKPNHPFRIMLIGQIRLKWVALIFIGIMLVSMLGNEGKNFGGNIAHIGGALYGALAGLWFLFGKKAFSPRPRKKREKYYSSYQASASAASDTSGSDTQQQKDEKRVEVILSKIAKDGYGALTPEERDFLYHYKKK